MTLVSFGQLPEDARLWVFAASRSLAAQEAETLLDHIDTYLHTWKAHGAPLRAGRDWRHDRFLLVAVDEAAAGASGCSIDGLVGSVRAAEGAVRVTLTDNAPIWFRERGHVQQVSRAEFRELAQRGKVGPDTIVFDNTITTLGAVQGGRWEVPARLSWHGRAFFADRLAPSTG